MLNCPKCGVSLKLEMGVKLAEESKAPQSAAPAGWPQTPSTNNLGALLMRIDDRRLQDNERQFVNETRERFQKYGARTKLSEKQQGWLERIAVKSAA